MNLKSYESKIKKTQFKMINALISKTNGPVDFTKFKVFNKFKQNVKHNKAKR